MKTINVLKILNEEDKQKQKSRISNDDYTILKDKILNFIDNFIIPYIKLELSELKKAYYEDMLFNLIFETTKIAEEDKPMYDEEDFEFLYSSNRQVKVSVGKRYAELIMNFHTQKEKEESYYNEYIIPLLKELNENGIIIFDKKALDNKTKISTDRIEKFVKSIITEKASENEIILMYKKIKGIEYVERNNVFFGTDIDVKNKFKDFIKKQLENIENIDLKSIKQLDIWQLDGFEL